MLVPTYMQKVAESFLKLPWQFQEGRINILASNKLAKRELNRLQAIRSQGVKHIVLWNGSIVTDTSSAQYLHM